MGNRSFLYVLPAADQQEDFRGQQVAEANTFSAFSSTGERPASR